MIKHIVFFKLDEKSIGFKDELITKLNRLKDDMDYIKALEVGINFTNSPRAFDISLTVLLNSKDDLIKYATDPKHKIVIDFIRSLNIETKVVDYELPKKSSSEFGNATIVKKANSYFDGKVTSRTVIESDGTKKTLGIMMPGTYTFNTQQAEHIQIISGKVSVAVMPEEGNIEDIKSGEYFEIPANSSFTIKVEELTDYCCTYID